MTKYGPLSRRGESDAFASILTAMDPAFMTLTCPCDCAVCSYSRLRRAPRAAMDKPDTTNKAVAGSGTVVDVTVNVPTGLRCIQWQDTDDVAGRRQEDSGFRRQTRKRKKVPWEAGDGWLACKEGGFPPAAFRRASPTKVAVGVTCSPTLELIGDSPNVAKEAAVIGET